MVLRSEEEDEVGTPGKTPATLTEYHAVNNSFRTSVRSIKDFEKKWNDKYEKLKNGEQLLSIVKLNRKLAEDCSQLISTSFLIHSNKLLGIFQADSILAFRHCLDKSFPAYEIFMSENTNNVVLNSFILLVQVALQSKMVRLQRVERDVMKLKWKSREDIMKLKEEACEIERDIVHRQLISVLEERFKVVASKKYQPWKYRVTESFSQMAAAFEAHLDNARVPNGMWKMEPEEVSSLKYAITTLFPDKAMELKNDQAIFKFLKELAKESKGARAEAKTTVHPETLTVEQIEPLVKGTTYEKWFDALKKTKTLAEFGSMMILAFRQ
jgi:hypothetical protein